jgi:hypothetical protein
MEVGDPLYVYSNKASEYSTILTSRRRYKVLLMQVLNGIVLMDILDNDRDEITIKPAACAFIGNTPWSVVRATEEDVLNYLIGR